MVMTLTSALDTIITLLTFQCVLLLVLGVGFWSDLIWRWVRGK